MLTVKKPLGFAGVEQTAEFFGVPKQIVREKANSGEWPSYVISGSRVFNIDELLKLLATDQGEQGHAD